MYMTKSLVSALMLAILAASLSACGSKGHGDKSKTQVVAKVNGDEISVHQLNFQLSRLGQLSAEQSKAVSRQVLEHLVDQQLLLQQALEAKLDRDPRVLQVVEASRREILTQAYMEQQLASAKKPSAQEINAFYDKHPELFEKRRLYRLQELAVDAGHDKLAEIEAAVKANKDLNSIGVWLKGKNYQFTASGNVRAAEQLPLELLPRLQQMKDGEFVIIPTEHAINIVMLAASQEQPIDREKSKPMIEQYFVNQSKTEIAKKSLEKLHAAAKIEYVGAFADMKSGVSKEKAPQPAADAKAPAKPAVGDPEHINKGLSGL